MIPSYENMSLLGILDMIGLLFFMATMGGDV